LSGKNFSSSRINTKNRITIEEFCFLRHIPHYQWQGSYQGCSLFDLILYFSSAIVFKTGADENNITRNIGMAN